jgi:hypothetical protein
MERAAELVPDGVALRVEHLRRVHERQQHMQGQREERKPEQSRVTESTHTKGPKRYTHNT